MEWRDVISQIEQNQDEAFLALEGKRSWPESLDFGAFDGVFFPKYAKAKLVDLLHRSEKLITEVQTRKSDLLILLEASRSSDAKRPRAVDMRA